MSFEKEVVNWQEVGTDIPDTKLSEGWQASEKPPANWFNRLFYSISQAIQELQSKAVEKDYVNEVVNVLQRTKVSTENMTSQTGASEELVMTQKGVTDALDTLNTNMNNNLLAKLDKSNLTDEVGISTTLVMSQYGVNEALKNKVGKSAVVNDVGTSSTSVASQKLVTLLDNAQTEALANGLSLKFDISNVVSETGDNNNLVISQKGVTNLLKTKVDTSNIELSVSDSTTRVPSSYAVKEYINKNIPSISYGNTLPQSANEGDVFILF